MASDYEVAVIGGGQAGLAIGYFLRQDFLGLSWQHTRGSALIGWVKDDAKFIADQVAAARARELEPVLAIEGV